MLYTFFILIFFYISSECCLKLKRKLNSIAMRIYANTYLQLITFNELKAE